MSARQKTRPGPQSPPASSKETPLADFLTVCWMLAVMTTLLCEVGVGISLLVLTQRPDTPQLAALAEILLFAALVVGLAMLAFLPVLWRMRKEPPPGPIVWFAVLIGAAPIAIMLAGLFR